MNKVIIWNLLLVISIFSTFPVMATQRQMENLDRGLVAVRISNGIYLSWRFLGTDDTSVGFNIYRDDVLVNQTPITSSTNYTDHYGKSTSNYKVIPVINSVEESGDNKTVTPWARQYNDIQLNRPKNGFTEPTQHGSVGKTPYDTYPNGQHYGYSPNDCSVADLDGDGEYEIIVKWDPSNSCDNSEYGITGKVYIDAYKLDGTQLWRIDLGLNIRAGAHYTQFLVYDFDGDGKAELICKTAPGTVDGDGTNVIMNNDDPNADYRSLEYSQRSGSTMLGTVQKGPEYLTLFDGLTGAELNTIEYNPTRGSSSWGDSYGNRGDRFLACVAYLDGVHPNAVMCRGYYTRTTLAAYSVKDKKLVATWFHDSGTTAGVGAYGQGNHNLSVADVDNDGKDEIIYGSCAFDDDGSLLYSTKLGHGDAIHLSDMDPTNPGLEVWEVHEDKSVDYGYELHDAATGKILWGTKTASDNGRGMAGDIDSRHPGFEMWSSAGSGTYNYKGEQISTKKPSTNFRIYWDGDLQDELLDNVKISKWTGNGTSTILSCKGVASCNSTKATPNLSADILGDWREELILWTTADSSKIRIYTTTTPTSYRLFTLMHDPVYRLAVAWQNAAYNQPPHLGFYIGGGLNNVDQPEIYTVEADTTQSGNVSVPTNKTIDNTSVFCSNGILKVFSTETIQSVEIYSLVGSSIYKSEQIKSLDFSYKLPENEQLVIVRIVTDSGQKTVKIIK